MMGANAAVVGILLGALCHPVGTSGIHSWLHLVLAEGADPQQILRRGVEAAATIRRFELVEPRLHEIFVQHAGAAASGDGGLPRDADLGGGVR